MLSMWQRDEEEKKNKTRGGRGKECMSGTEALNVSAKSDTKDVTDIVHVL